jgi:toxin ParE1/3/4
MANVVWGSGAIDDIRGIIRYINDHDPIAAQDIAIRLFNLGDSLATFPRRGRPKGGIREMTSVPPYILRYAVEGDTVFILSVHHGARHLD